MVNFILHGTGPLNLFTAWKLQETAQEAVKMNQFFFNLIFSRHITILSLFWTCPWSHFYEETKIALWPWCVSDSRIKKDPLWLSGSMSSSVALYLLMPLNSHLSRGGRTKAMRTIWHRCCANVNETFCSCFSSLERSLEQCQSTLPHWRRTETPAVKGWCQMSGENRLLVPTVCLHWAKGYLHMDSSHLTGNPPPPSPFTTPWKSFALWSARTEQPDTWHILVTGTYLWVTLAV